MSDFGARVMEVSTKYTEMQRIWIQRQEDEETFRSCPPLLMKVGNLVTFRKLTFPIIIQDIVITCVINLQLAFGR